MANLFDDIIKVQLSRGYLKEMRGLARKSPVAHEILYYLVEHMGRTTNAVVCSRNVLAEVTGCSIATVGRAIRVLKDDNWIDTVKIGNASAYCVNERAFWQAGRKSVLAGRSKSTAVCGFLRDRYCCCL